MLQKQAAAEATFERARALLRERRLDVPLRKPDASFAEIAAQAPEVSPETMWPSSWKLSIKYERLYRAAAWPTCARFRRAWKSMPLPEDADYLAHGRIAAWRRGQKLDRHAAPPPSGQASRVPGVSPGDVSGADHGVAGKAAATSARGKRPGNRTRNAHATGTSSKRGLRPRAWRRRRNQAGNARRAFTKSCSPEPTRA